jgi:hypothetical protein
VYVQVLLRGLRHRFTPQPNVDSIRRTAFLPFPSRVFLHFIEIPSAMQMGASVTFLRFVTL